MGSPTLMIILILVVWIIVLAPLAIGNNKPIRRSGEGYEETRVLHSGGTEPMATRRRPKLTAADVHRHSEDEDYELAEVVDEPLLIDDAPALRIFPHRDDEDFAAHIDGEVIDHVEDEVSEEAPAEADAEVAEAADAVEAPEPAAGGSTAWSVLRAQAEAEEAERYQVDESYEAPSDYGYEESEVAEAEDHEVVDEDVTDLETADEADTADETVEVAEEAEADDEDIAFAASRRGRGGYDPERERTTTATRFQRRQRTLLGLIAACVVTFVVAFVVGGWAWVLPVVALGLTGWFMVALRRVVLQERALRNRRLRQLRRARLGVVTAGEDAPRDRRRGGSTVVALDDEHPDFDALPTTRYTAEGPDAPEAARYPRVSRPARHPRHDDFDGDFGAQAS